MLSLRNSGRRKSSTRVSTNKERLVCLISTRPSRLVCVTNWTYLVCCSYRPHQPGSYLILPANELSYTLRSMFRCCHLLDLIFSIRPPTLPISQLNSSWQVLVYSFPQRLLVSRISWFSKHAPLCFGSFLELEADDREHTGHCAYR